MVDEIGHANDRMKDDPDKAEVDAMTLLISLVMRLVCEPDLRNFDLRKLTGEQTIQNKMMNNRLRWLTCDDDVR